MHTDFIKEKAKQRLHGIHIYSLCDVRNKKAAKLEKEIEHTIKHYHDAEKRAKFDFYTAKANGDVAAAKMIGDAISNIKKKAHDHLTKMYAELRRVSLVRQETVHNILPTAGRTVVARWLTGDNTYDADDGVNYGSLGDTNTTPANGNTQINNESYRKATSSATYSSNVAYLSNFYTATEVTGTIEEAGWHIAGTGTANTGQLFSHFLTGTITKTSTETLTVESQITIS